MEAARIGSGATKSSVKRPMLVSSPLAVEAVREVNEKKTLTLKDVMERLHCGKNAAIRLVKHEPGVLKPGKFYIIPQASFDRILFRSLVGVSG